MRLVVGVCVLLGAPQLAVSHHACSAEFDAARPVELRGVVTKLEWINPHSWITMDVTTADGAVETWMIETGAPNSMVRRGFAASTGHARSRDTGSRSTSKG
jgi:hypothetical protein